MIGYRFFIILRMMLIFFISLRLLMFRFGVDLALLGLVLFCIIRLMLCGSLFRLRTIWAGLRLRRLRVRFWFSFVLLVMMSVVRRLTYLLLRSVTVTFLLCIRCAALMRILVCRILRVYRLTLCLDFLCGNVRLIVLIV